MPEGFKVPEGLWCLRAFTVPEGLRCLTCLVPDMPGA